MEKYTLRYDIPGKFWYVSGHNSLSQLSNRKHYVLETVQIGIDKSGCYVTCDSILERKSLRPKAAIAFRYTPITKNTWQWVNGNTLYVGTDSGKGLASCAEQLVLTNGCLLEMSKKVR